MLVEQGGRASDHETRLRRAEGRARLTKAAGRRMVDHGPESPFGPMLLVEDLHRPIDRGDTPPVGLGLGFGFLAGPGQHPLVEGGVQQIGDLGIGQPVGGRIAFTELVRTQGGGHADRPLTGYQHLHVAIAGGIDASWHGSGQVAGFSLDITAQHLGRQQIGGPAVDGAGLGFHVGHIDVHALAAAFGVT